METREVFFRRALGDAMIDLEKIKDKVEQAYEELEREDFATGDYWKDCNSELYSSIYKLDQVLEHAHKAIDLMFSKEEYY